MTEPIRDPTIRGKTIQFRWTDGPTKGMTHEHIFHLDGTVEWHDAERRADRGGPSEKATYAAVPVADGAYLVCRIRAAARQRRHPEAATRAQAGARRGRGQRPLSG